MKHKMTIIHWLLLALVGLALIIFLGWRYIQSTPQYSLYQMYEAVRAKDYPTFTKYADVDAIANNVVNRAVDNLEKNTLSKADNPLTKLGANLAQGLIANVKPRLVDTIKEGIREGVASGSIKQATFKENNLLVIFKLVHIKQYGRIAIVSVPINNKPLHIKMRKVEDHWQIYDLDLTPTDFQMK